MYRTSFAFKKLFWRSGRPYWGRAYSLTLHKALVHFTHRTLKPLSKLQHQWKVCF